MNMYITKTIFSCSDLFDQNRGKMLRISCKLKLSKTMQSNLIQIVELAYNGINNEYPKEAFEASSAFKIFRS